ncbi:MAG: ABC transporter permease [Bacteroidetes bacterium]|nr:ABC transporter permease [Bacteroidota bacterium]
MPKIFVYIFKWLFVNNHPEAMIGDIDEEYLERCADKGKLAAFFWLVKQVVISIPLHFSNSLFWGVAMFKNYLKIGYRNLIKEKLISIISISGLGIGFAAAGLILIYIHLETSFDKFFDNSERIYRLYTQTSDADGNDSGYGVVIGGITPALLELADVESVTSLYNLRGSEMKIGSERYTDLRILSADSCLFDVFNYKVINGDVEKVMKDPSVTVITESMALKFWGTTDVLGQNIEFSSNFFVDRTYRIAAVIEDIPNNSHLRFDILCSHYSQPILEKFGGDEFLTYFKLKELSEPELSLGVINEACEEVNKPRREGGYKGHTGIIPIEDIHLKGSSLFRGFSGEGDLVFLYILAIVGIAILFIAILNFVNLLTAKFQNRFNEIAVRKVVGAQRNSILAQFISEATLIAFVSFIISLIVILLTLSNFGKLIDRNLDVYYKSFHWIAIGILALSLLVAFSSAIFPALRISRMKCVNILKNKSGGGKINRLLPATVIVQFAIVITLIVSITVIYSQIKFLKQQDLGFDSEQQVYFSFADSEKYISLKNKLEENSDIISVAASQSIPGKGRSGQLGKITGVIGGNIGFSENRVQPGYIETYGMKLLAGRAFQKNSQSDRETVILNEKFVKMMNLSPEEALERELEYNGRKMRIIGVIKDFHYSSFENNIEPLALSNYSDRIVTITAKINSANVKETLNFIEETAKEFSPGFVFDYSFIDELFGEMYRNDEINNMLLIYSALLSISLSVMGLFAVTMFAVSKRTKEIGIRKVLGGSVSGINILLLKDYLVWVLISNIIAWPIAHYLLTSWLQDFTVRIDLHLGFYILAGITALFIAMLTVIFITTSAAMNNPVDNLRYE